jgi:hypothetical protein
MDECIGSIFILFYDSAHFSETFFWGIFKLYLNSEMQTQQLRNEESLLWYFVAPICLQQSLQVVEGSGCSKNSGPEQPVIQRPWITVFRAVSRARQNRPKPRLIITHKAGKAPMFMASRI